MTKKKPVVVLYGGTSSEHEISCRSASFLVKNIDVNKYNLRVIGIKKDGFWYCQKTEDLINSAGDTLSIDDTRSFSSVVSENDPYAPGISLLRYVQQELKEDFHPSEICVFPITHGTDGEDGRLQGFLELAGFSYIGPDTLGSAIGMDKHVAKVLVSDIGINVVPYTVIRKHSWDKIAEQFIETTLSQLGENVFVKPASLGSSVGITKVEKSEELRGAVDYAFQFDQKVLVEMALDVREIECGAVGSYEPEISRAGEVNATGDFYSYDAKYIDKEGAIIKVPADLTPDKEAEIRRLSAEVFKALNLYGIARIDWFLEKSSSKYYFNEVNTLPGLTSISQYPLLWEHSGVDPKSLIAKIIELGFDRGAMKRSLKKSIC